MRDDKLKRHMGTKHRGADEIVQHGTEHQNPLQASFETDAQDVQQEQANNPTESCNQEEELKAEINAGNGNTRELFERQRRHWEAI